MVGLCADQEQDVVADLVGAAAQLDRGPVERGVDAVDQVHDRPAGPVVEQLVGAVPKAKLEESLKKHL